MSSSLKPKEIAPTRIAQLADRITKFIHHHFIAVLLLTDLLAGLVPAPGLVLREIVFGRLYWIDQSSVTVSLSFVMLTILLFNSGLGIQVSEVKKIARFPGRLAAGLIANTVVPLLVVLALRGLIGLWPNNTEIQWLLVGLAIVIAMPISSTSPAWAQNANGNVSLSLGLVIVTTLLSPLTTPLVLHAFGFLTSGKYANDLHGLATQGANGFMFYTVVLPSMLGIRCHFLLGERRLGLMKPYLKLINFSLILALIYSNAATALPKFFAQPDLYFVVFSSAVTITLCATAFGGGWLISKWLKTDKSDQAALMFSLGMNNNGTGLVLAATALAQYPSVLLPIIFYTLIQHVMAGIVDWKLFRGDAR